MKITPFSIIDTLSFFNLGNVIFPLFQEQNNHCFFFSFNQSIRLPDHILSNIRNFLTVNETRFWWWCCHRLCYYSKMQLVSFEDEDRFVKTEQQKNNRKRNLDEHHTRTIDFKQSKQMELIELNEDNHGRSIDWFQSVFMKIGWKLFFNRLKKIFS